MTGRATHYAAAVTRRLSLVLLASLSAALPSRAQSAFTLEQVTSAPYPTDLTAAATGNRIAWVFFERGVRNVYVAEGPDFRARKLTAYTDDDGQEITNLSLSADGKTVVYTRGGDHGSNFPAEGGLQPDPTSSPVQPQVEIWAVGFDGGSPRRLAQGDAPVISPRSDRIAYTVGGQVFVVPLDGSATGKRLFFSRGVNGALEWSPDGHRLAFVSNRGDHAFIGVFASESEPILWLAPTTNRDISPRWSPDGSRIAFIRLRGQGGAPAPFLKQQPNPWQIWTADARTGEGRSIWKSPLTLRGSLPTSEGGPNLHWMAGGRITFLADLDGWAHLYSIPESGGTPQLLTPGAFMTEYISPSPDGRSLVYAANTGPNVEDLDRRHIFRVPVDREGGEPVQLVPGTGLEWTPFVTGDGRSVAFLASTYQRSPLPMVVDLDGGSPRTIAEDRVPEDFPASQMIAPKMVSFHAADGMLVHGQLFEAPGGAPKKPAVVFVHGGPPRQMLLGWHYMYYYANSYAMNQYLASRGYVVLSVNYRLGIGYGYAFHHPPNAGAWGASEYNDVKAGAVYLRGLPQVDARRVGIYGGSYGGFLTALALGRNSDLFAAGVDIHGVHDFTENGGSRFGANTWRYEKGDAEEASRVAWRSSPVSAVPTWRSPVLLIHGDDDRNVRFHQTVDLARRLAAKGVDYEEMVLPDEIHDFLLYRSWTRIFHATAEYFDRKLAVAAATTRATSGTPR
jgi:dipeptidyl aminopeptidase/acylaminoacyl peptidase